MASTKAGNSKPSVAGKNLRWVRDTDQRLTVILSEYKFPEIQNAAESFKRDAALLEDLQKQRAAVARQLRSLTARRRALVQALFSVCTEVRRRVRNHFRGTNQEKLRKAFAEGLSASPSKPQSVLIFSSLILASAKDHSVELRRTRLGRSTLGRIERLQSTIKKSKESYDKLLEKQRRLTREALMAQKSLSRLFMAIQEILKEAN